MLKKIDMTEYQKRSLDLTCSERKCADTEFSE